MELRKSVLVAGLVVGFLSVSVAHAEETLICRGDSTRGVYARELRDQIKTALEAQGIQVRRVRVSSRLLASRPRKIAADDFSSGIVISENPFSVSFNGEFPAPEACTLQVRYRIVAATDAGNSVTTRDVEFIGTYLTTPRPGRTD